MGKQETRGASGPVMRGSVLQGVGEQGWQSRGAVRLRGQAGRRRPWLAVSQVHDFRPAKPQPPPRHSRVRTACLGGLRGQAHGAQVQGALAQRPVWQT